MSFETNLNKLHDLERQLVEVVRTQEECETKAVVIRKQCEVLKKELAGSNNHQLQSFTENKVERVKTEDVVESKLFRLSIAEWMTIAHRQKFRCACGCGALLAPTANITRKIVLPDRIIDSLDMLQSSDMKCNFEQSSVAELGCAADRARLILAWSQEYKCHGYGAPCSLHLVPEVFNVDHRNPTRWGGVDDATNKHILCPNCHAKKSSHETSLSTSGSFIPPPMVSTVDVFKDDGTSESDSEEESQKKKVGRPKKYANDAERRAAKAAQTRQSEQRQGHARQKAYNRRTQYKTSLDAHQLSGYAAQKRYRERKKELKRLENLAKSKPPCLTALSCHPAPAPQPLLPLLPDPPSINCILPTGAIKDQDPSMNQTSHTNDKTIVKQF